MHCRLLQQASYCKKVDSLTADELVKAAKIVFKEFQLPKKFISDVGINFTSDTLKVLQADEYRADHHHRNGQVDECIKFIKCTIEKCLDTNHNVNLALLHIKSTFRGTGLPSPSTMLFNRPIRGLLHQMNREQININNDDAQNIVLKYIKIIM